MSEISTTAPVARLVTKVHTELLQRQLLLELWLAATATSPSSRLGAARRRTQDRA